MINICGLGWISEEGYGCVRKSVKTYQLHSAISNKREIFLYPFENFGRLDAASKMTCCAVSLALKDTGLTYPLHRKPDIGIAGTNSSGCLSSDVRYFKDYLDHGRTLARGNLFIYTIPSSPVSEAAIHFGLQGPLFYMTGPESPLAGLVDMAAEIICLDEASMMLIGTATENNALFFTMAGDSSDYPEDVLCDIEQAKPILTKDLSFLETIEQFSLLR